MLLQVHLASESFFAKTAFVNAVEVLFVSHHGLFAEHVLVTNVAHQVRLRRFGFFLVCGARHGR